MTKSDSIPLDWTELSEPSKQLWWARCNRERSRVCWCPFTDQPIGSPTAPVANVGLCFALYLVKIVLQWAIGRDNMSIAWPRGSREEANLSFNSVLVKYRVSVWSVLWSKPNRNTSQYAFYNCLPEHSEIQTENILKIQVDSGWIIFRFGYMIWFWHP